MTDKDYILFQRRVFKKYNKENHNFYKIVCFNQMCAEIACHKKCELNFHTAKEIMRIVRKYIRENNNKGDDKNNVD